MSDVPEDFMQYFDWDTYQGVAPVDDHQGGMSE